MPYIKPEDRLILDPIINQLPLNLSVGEMNYIFTRIVHKFISVRGISYANLSAAAATLSDCREEFVRQVVAPYEDRKKSENGDISNLDKHQKTLEDVR